MSHETLTFVVLWIVNALIALIYLLIGALVYVPACDLKQEQGEEVQYDNRRAFLIRLSSWCSARSSVRRFFCAVIFFSKPYSVRQSIWRMLCLVRNVCGHI